MGAVTTDPDLEYHLAAMGAANPATTPEPPGFGTGFWSSLVQGPVGGAAAMARLGATVSGMQGGAQAAQSIAENPWADQSLLQDLQPSPASGTPPSDMLKHVEDWARIDPRETGTAGQVTGGLLRGLTIFSAGSALMGPAAGAGLLGVTEGHSDYNDAVAAGVDVHTALAKAGLTGATAAAGAVMPFTVSRGAATGLLGLGMRAEASGNSALADVLYGAAKTAGTLATSLPARALTGGAANTIFGAAQRAGVSAVLEAGGYHDMAAQYRVLDSEAAAADFVMGLAFGVLSHDPVKRPTPEMVSAALDARRNELITRGGPGIPTTPDIANLDIRLQNEAVGDITRGQNPEITPDNARELLSHVLADPEREWMQENWWRVMDDMHDALSAPGHVPVLTERADVPQRLDDTFDTGAKKAPPTTDTSAGISPLSLESLRQTATMHPHLEVTLPDGRIVHASELEQTLMDEMAKSNEDAKLHDAAIACALRTE